MMGDNLNLPSHLPLREDEFSFADRPDEEYAAGAGAGVAAGAGAAATTSFVREEVTYPIVEVIAPASLSTGYTFDVEVNHQIFTVTVPFGGVREGQKFRAQTKPKIEESTTQYRIPLGLWKDGLCDFFKYGPCHSSFLLSCLCPLISLGQVYTRLELQWNGTPYNHNYHNDNPTTMAFKVMIGITFGYFFLKQVIFYLEMTYHSLYLLNLIYMTLIAILVGRTRRHIREKYDIPGTFTQLRESNDTVARCCGNGRDDDDEDGILPVCCGEVEDFCLGFVCYPCVVSQMNRHTAMYDTYEGSLFSSNGLPKHAPTMI
jgi:hypothetical protein